jgi:hypothetical protein
MWMGDTSGFHLPDLMKWKCVVALLMQGIKTETPNKEG